VLQEDAETPRDELAKAENGFEISEPDAFAAPGLRLASSGLGLTAESGFMRVSCNNPPLFEAKIIR
jgi:hypothetical protein